MSENTGSHPAEHYPVPVEGAGDHVAEAIGQSEISSAQRSQALNGLLLEVTSEVYALTDPKQGGRHYSDPEVQARKAVESAFRERHRNYLDDTQPEGELLGTSEQRTPHEVAEDAYNLLLAYTSDKLSDPALDPSKAESLRIAQDTLQAERQIWKDQFEVQDQAIDDVMSIVGRENELFSEAKVRAAIRDCAGAELPRLQELIKIAAETTNPHERFAILNDLQRQNSPIKDAQAFEDWKHRRSVKAQAEEQQRAQDREGDARQAIEEIHAKGDSALVAETPKAGSPDISESETVPAAELEARQAGLDTFLTTALKRVPQKVLVESLNSIAETASRDGERVDVKSLWQELGRRVNNGSLGINSTQLELLAKRVHHNGFSESNGGIWRVDANPNTAQGKIAAEAKQLVKEILTATLAN